MYGGRISLSISFLVVFLEVIIGVLLGGLAGYFGGWVDMVIMRIVDIFNCLPDLPLLLIVGAVLDALDVPATNRIYFMMTFLTFFGWTGTARIVRGQILSLREQEFMVSAMRRGLSTPRQNFPSFNPEYHAAADCHDDARTRQRHSDRVDALLSESRRSQALRGVGEYDQ